MATDRVTCPACGRATAVIRWSGKLRWHYNRPGSVLCIGTGLTVEQYRPGMTQTEANAVRYANTEFAKFHQLEGS